MRFLMPRDYDLDRGETPAVKGVTPYIAGGKSVLRGNLRIFVEALCPTSGGATTAAPRGSCIKKYNR